MQATKASVENLNLLQQGKGEIAFALGDSVKLAAEGNTEAGFPGKLDKLRGIAAIYPNYIQIVASQESGIKTLADLKGKSLSVGAPASGTELNARAIFAAAGMNYEDLGKVEYLPFAESVELIKNRQLDATLQSAGLGVASIRDLATSLPINVVAVPAETVGQDRRALCRRRPSRPAPMKARPTDVATAAVGNFLVTHDGVSDETAYQMTKLLFENLDQLAAAHAAAKAHRPGQGARRHAGAAASGRRALLQGEGAAEVARFAMRGCRMGEAAPECRRIDADIPDRSSPATAEEPIEGLPPGFGDGHRRQGRLRHRGRLLRLPALRRRLRQPAEPGGAGHACRLPAAARLRADRQSARRAPRPARPGSGRSACSASSPASTTGSSTPT